MPSQVHGHFRNDLLSKIGGFGWIPDGRRHNYCNSNALVMATSPGKPPPKFNVDPRHANDKAQTINIEIWAAGGWNDSLEGPFMTDLSNGCGNNIAVNSQGFDVGGYAMTEKTRRTKFALSCFGAGSHKSADVGNPNSYQ